MAADPAAGGFGPQNPFNLVTRPYPDEPSSADAFLANDGYFSSERGHGPDPASAPPVYVNPYPSSDNHSQKLGYPSSAVGTSTYSPTVTATGYGPGPFSDPQPLRQREPYPAWTEDHDIPLSKEEIEDIFINLANKFGFQRDSMRNMYDHLMILLDSRASRMSPALALATLHADYIGGEHANYRKWYFASQLDLDDAIGRSQNPGLSRATSMRRTGQSGSAAISTASAKSLQSASARWREAMHRMNDYDRLRQIALWLMCWGEGGQARFIPECLCFIFKCADDYYRSPECQERLDPVPEGLFLRAVVRPLYRFLRDQIFEVVDGKFVKKEKDHDQIIGYDDVNQLFWYPEGISRIVLQDRTRLVDIPPQQRFMKFDKIDWNRVFVKNYRESRSWGHLIVNFNRIWILHISVFWYYTACVLIFSCIASPCLTQFTQCQRTQGVYRGDTERSTEIDCLRAGRGCFSGNYVAGNILRVGLRWWEQA